MPGGAVDVVREGWLDGVSATRAILAELPETYIVVLTSFAKLDDEGVRTSFQNPPLIRIGGQQSRSLYQYTLQAQDLNELYAASASLEKQFRDIPELTDVSSDLKISSPLVSVDIDRDHRITGRMGHDIRGAGRKSRFFQDLGMQQAGRDRSQLGWLDHHRIARRQRCRHGGQGPDAQDIHALITVHRLQGQAQGVQALGAMAHKHLALGREHGAFATALDQHTAHDVFQLVQRLADCGLRHGQHLGRRPQRALSGHHDQGLHMSKAEAIQSAAHAKS